MSIANDVNGILLRKSWRVAFLSNYRVSSRFLAPSLSLTLIALAASALCAQQATTPAASQAEVQELRQRVDALTQSITELRALLAAQGKLPPQSTAHNAKADADAAPASVQANTQSTPSSSLDNLPLEQPSPGAATVQSATQRPAIVGTPQTTGLPDDRNLAMAVKANGGDLSGAGNLLRTDRVALGGYGDFQFREAGLNERNDGGGTPTFQSTRFVLGIAAVLAKQQNIVFNSEIEFEFGAREIDVEQAFLEWKARPEFNFRAGIYPPSLGHFNVYHDSNLNLVTLRPLMNQFIINTAYRDAGIGVRGRFNLPAQMKLTYEANVVNGMQPLDGDGVATPFSRLVGQSSATEPGLIAFQATNGHKAFAGRIGYSPLLGLEIGGSVYNGRINLQDNPPRSVTMLFYDTSYRRGAWAFDAEYARTNIVGNGIFRQSPAPPVFNAANPASVAALAAYVAEPTPGQDGFYVEGARYYYPSIFRTRLDRGAYLAPVVRYEGIRRDRTLSNFYLNETRTTVGFNVAPSPQTIFKFNYVFNNPQGAIPSITGPIGGADFGNNPVPFRSYGHNGFTGSVAYAF